jgi:hypothetical protein
MWNFLAVLKQPSPSHSFDFGQSHGFAAQRLNVLAVHFTAILKSKDIGQSKAILKSKDLGQSKAILKSKDIGQSKAILKS